MLKSIRPPGMARRSTEIKKALLVEFLSTYNKVVKTCAFQAMLVGDEYLRPQTKVTNIGGQSCRADMKFET